MHIKIAAHRYDCKPNARRTASIARVREPALPTHWEAADAAAARCAEDAGIPVKIAVVESGGNLAAFLRMPGAFLHWSIPRSTRSTPQRASSELKRGHLYFGERGHCDFGLTNV